MPPGLVRRGWSSAVAVCACHEEEPAAAAAAELEPDASRTGAELVPAFAERLCQSAEPLLRRERRRLRPRGLRRRRASGRLRRRPPTRWRRASPPTTKKPIEPCLAAHAVSHQTCVADWRELLELGAASGRRARWCVARAPPGRGCTTSVTCAQPEGASVARCVAGHAAACSSCSARAPSARIRTARSRCATRASTARRLERDEIGVCAPVTPNDAACDPVPLNPECGLGSYCDRDAAVCRSAENFGGPSCELRARVRLLQLRPDHRRMRAAAGHRG